jgi:hypothetical protein
MALAEPSPGVGDEGFQRGAVHAVAPHDGLNDRICEHVAKGGLNAGTAPRLTIVQRGRQLGLGEVLSHG